MEPLLSLSQAAMKDYSFLLLQTFPNRDRTGRVVGRNLDLSAVALERTFPRSWKDHDEDARTTLAGAVRTNRMISGNVKLIANLDLRVDCFGVLDLFGMRREG